jgi:hypothetical protein
MSLKSVFFKFWIGVEWKLQSGSPPHGYAPTWYTGRWLLQWKHTIVVKVNVMLTIEQAMQAQRESWGIIVPFFNFGTRWRWVVNAMPQPLYPRERDLVPTIQEAGLAPQPVWTSAEKLTSTNIWCPLVQPVASHYTNYLVLGGRCYSVYAWNTSNCAVTWLRIT